MARKPPPVERPGPTTFAGLGALKASLPEGPQGPKAGTKTANLPKPAPPPRFVVRRSSKGFGGKWVTVVEGAPPAEAEGLCVALKRGLGTGARVEEGQIVVQGDIPDRVVSLLQARWPEARVIRGN